MGFYVRLANTEGQSGFYYPEKILTREQIIGFWEHASDDAKREIRDMALFQESKGKLLKNEELNREAKVKMVETAGNMNLVTPDRLMAGAYVTDSDTKGCVVSRKTADTLFGSWEAVGERVTLGRNTYIVRGIVEMEGQLCMIQGEKGRTYSCIRIEAPGVPLSVVRQRLAGILIEEKGWISEGDLYLGIGRLFLYLPLWFLLFLLLSRVGKMLPEMFRFAIPIMGFAGICSLLLLSLHFSDDYVPSAWSDFPFWIQLFDEKKQAFFSLLHHPLYDADFRMLGSLAGLLAAAFFVCWIVLIYGRLVIFEKSSCEIAENLQTRNH
ncbi:hypothetical protein IMSAGC018_01879 [Lachnospiraceae bacterium]|jgi:hypothetical protein|nr:hypothetical protein IMSAGC018_01879 [Lachnospiraceae bacterium]